MTEGLSIVPFTIFDGVAFTVPMARIHINSGTYAPDLPSMPIAVAQRVAANVGAV